MSIIDKIQVEMKHSVDLQNELYDDIVLPALGKDNYESAYKKYMEELHGFDAQAFKKCLTEITKLNYSDPAEFANWADRFNYIPEYIVHRNEFDKKTDEINEVDGSPQDKELLFDALDRKRTRAHNGVISLFNKINEFAESKNIVQPYPTSKPFNPKDPVDRGRVADILTKQETLLENINLIIQKEKIHESDKDRYSKMSIGELFQEAKKTQVQKDSEPEL